MPTVLTPQGWVKVAPTPRKKTVTIDPAVALKGPLAYFSCQPLPSTRKEPVNRPQYPYDLSASPEKLQRQSATKANVAGKNRTISAPQIIAHEREYHDDEYEERQSQFSHSSRSASPPPPAHTKSHKSPRSRKPRHDEDSTSSSSGSTRSYPRHRPVQAAARPTTMNHHPSMPPGGYYGHNGYHSAPGLGMYDRQPPPSNARSMSYSWYNATTPLNM
ncbi:hypothetical protein PV05_01488 [Exophiala xenobiotica]|uniref:Uncharacterized protein n=1 Tax=Exophiala xenobiotica TaxID=348802 RepID=A0A0D2DGB8_9EURO|nr:uncharacterized protein PV05_01488 [Exophiala xenobiotica]KIW61357.1 hypothetical protein PV05_01488 [Exophiala xenobiotica]